MLHGVVNLWKPTGITSHTAVNKLRRLLGQKRIGHTGTLDPLAQGVLPMCLGDATRIAEYISAEDKIYKLKMRFGYISDTYDICGQTEKVKDPDYENLNIKQLLSQFVGVQLQLPPMYSAVSLNGQRLYHLARRGEVVNRIGRQINIHFIELLGEEITPLGLELELRVSCGKGTYIRSLVDDLGKAAGSGALLTELTREVSGGFQGEEAFTFEEIEDLILSEGKESILFPLSFKQLPLSHLELQNEEDEKLLQQGRLLSLKFESFKDADLELRALVARGKLLGIAQIINLDGEYFLKPRKNLANPLKFIF